MLFFNRSIAWLQNTSRTLNLLNHIVAMLTYNLKIRNVSKSMEENLEIRPDFRSSFTTPRLRRVYNLLQTVGFTTRWGPYGK